MVEITTTDQRCVRVSTATNQFGIVSIVPLDIVLACGRPNRLSVAGFEGREEAGMECLARVRGALKAAQQPFPSGHVWMVAPTGMAFDSMFDLAVAAGMLVLQNVIPKTAIADLVIVGPLAWNGRVESCRGVLPIVAEAARRTPRLTVLLPSLNSAEAALVDRRHFVGLTYLSEIVPVLTGTAFTPSPEPDIAEMKGLETAKRALAIAAAGGHHVLFVGPPGAGKTSLARRLPGLLPPLSREEALEITAMQSLAGVHVAGNGYLGTRPFRAPHHTVSEKGMFGSSRPCYRPGEVSLAHRGVLFLDEVPEFSRRILRGVGVALSGPELIKPLSRPLDTLCVAAMAACPCGWRGVGPRECRCSEGQVVTYRTAIRSLLERVDPIVVEVGGAIGAELPRYASTAEARARVVAARERQQRDGRLGTAGRPQLRELNADRLAKDCAADVKARLGREPDSASLGILRVARSIADLDDTAVIGLEQWMEADSLRPSWS